MIVREDSPLERIQGAQDLAGMRVAYWSGGYVPTLLRDESIRLSPTTGIEIREKVLECLANRRFDAFYLPTALFAGNIPPGSGFRQVPLPEPPLPLYSVFSHKKEKALLEGYESALREQMAIQPLVLEKPSI
ncbi:hypothetical protein D9M69_600550 [compost metagenome]